MSRAPQVHVNVSCLHLESLEQGARRFAAPSALAVPCEAVHGKSANSPILAHNAGGVQVTFLLLCVLLLYDRSLESWPLPRIRDPDIRRGVF